MSARSLLDGLFSDQMTGLTPPGFDGMRVVWWVRQAVSWCFVSGEGLKDHICRGDTGVTRRAAGLMLCAVYVMTTVRRRGDKEYSSTTATYPDWATFDRSATFYIRRRNRDRHDQRIRRLKYRRHLKEP